MKCPACSARIPDASQRCPACGGEIDRRAAVARALKAVSALKAQSTGGEPALPLATVVRIAAIGAVVLALLWSAAAVLRSVGRKPAPAPTPAAASAPAAAPPAADAAESAPEAPPAFVAGPAAEEAAEPAPPAADGTKVIRAKPDKALVPAPGRERPDGTWDSSLPPMTGVPAGKPR